MSSFKTITERPQASRIDRPKSCAEETSVSPMDSGGHKKPTSKSSRNTKIFKIITYNVRTLSSSSKLLEMEEEIKDISWDIIGLCETRRKEEQLLKLKSGHIIGLCETRRKEEQLLKLKSGHLFYQNENPNSPDGGIGFLINKRLEKSIVTLKTISDRVAYITLSISKRYEIKIIQVYAPTTAHTDEEVDIFYGDIEKALKENRCYYTFIMGDFNAKIGKQTDMSEVAIGSFGIVGRNERGQTLIDFLHNQKLYVMNSFFQKKLHRRWTWVNPNGRTKNEIDFFITTRKRFVTDVTVLNKFGIGSDHRAVRATVRINARNERQKMIRKKQQIKRLADGKKEIIKLKDNNKKETNNRRELVKIVEEFYKELYRSRREELNITENKMKVVNQGSELVLEITIEESKNALTEMKNKKAAGEDQIVIEAVKVGGGNPGKVEKCDDNSHPQKRGYNEP
ncbi:craniofacial development protein 2-like [Diorhabda carinulata]|uniref:craniofacial development protein 2-like n=1 Tax=Diorhabda carinulata TaxID=1163345 RepID=UPI0025A2E897|nr:craniofacial development protein 2-like [Diorhabda carinulata]